MLRNPYSFLISFGIVILLQLFYFVVPESEAAGSMGSLIGLLMLVLIALAQVSFLMIAYECWRQLQSVTTTTTPGLAIGYLFIPLFNYYWRFIAFYKMSKEANDYLASKGIAEGRFNPNVVLAMCIVSVLGPLIYIVPFFQAFIVFQWAKWLRVVRAAEYTESLLEKRG